MKLFFVEVQTYPSVNAMMKEIGKWTWLNYDRHIVNETMWADMVEAIRKKMKRKLLSIRAARPLSWRKVQITPTAA